MLWRSDSTPLSSASAISGSTSSWSAFRKSSPGYPGQHRTHVHAESEAATPGSRTLPAQKCLRSALGVSRGSQRGVQQACLCCELALWPVRPGNGHSEEGPEGTSAPMISTTRLLRCRPYRAAPKAIPTATPANMKYTKFFFWKASFLKACSSAWTRTQRSGARVHN